MISLSGERHVLLDWQDPGTMMILCRHQVVPDAAEAL